GNRQGWSIGADGMCDRLAILTEPLVTRESTGGLDCERCALVFLDVGGRGSGAAGDCDCDGNNLLETDGGNGIAVQGAVGGGRKRSGKRSLIKITSDFERAIRSGIDR